MLKTNQEFIDSDKSIVFKKACKLAGVEPTKRQAGKWRQKPSRGLAARYKEQAKRELREANRQK